MNKTAPISQPHRAVRLRARKVFILNLSFVLSTIGGMEVSSQSFPGLLSEMSHGTSTINDIERAFLKWSQTVPLDSAKGWKWYRRWEWFASRRAYTDGSFPDPRIYWREATALAERKERGSDILFTGSMWTPVGPTDIPPGDNELKAHGLGRINCVAFHPTDANTMWIGVAQGGVWKTVNGGESWRPLTDNLPILRISDIAVDPANTDVLYISVGDYAYLGTSLSTDQRKRNTHYGLGVYKTTDGGESWFPTGLSFQQHDFDGSLIRRVFVHPENSSHLLAAGVGGVWKSEDAGATWRRVFDRFIWDIERSPADPDILCASTGYSNKLQRGEAGIVYSSNFGESWNDAQANIPEVREVERIEISFSTINPNKVYAVSSARHQGFHSFYYSGDAGRTWLVRASASTNPNILGGFTGRESEGDHIGGQGAYDLTILADPKNEGHIYVGGVNLWGSTDDGLTWDIVVYGSNIWGPGLHADQHFLAFNRLNERYFVCNDGGIYTTDAIVPGSWDEALADPDNYRWATSWQSLNNGLAITSFYHVGLGPSGSGDLVAGAQDNSTYYRQGDAWINLFNGDGMECLIDPANPHHVYGSFQFGNLFRHDRQAGIQPEYISQFISENMLDAGEWSTPFQLDPTNSRFLYAAYGNVWRRDDLTTEWVPISDFPSMPDFNFPAAASAFIIAPSDPDRMYLAKRPWNSMEVRTRLYRTSDAGGEWIDITEGVPDTLFITSIDVDADDPDRVWISCAGFGEGVKIFQTEDGGNSWTNISRNLPNLPANVVVHDPASPRTTLYVGMDVGVYYMNDEMEGWEPYVEGLPNVIVTDLAIDPLAGRLVASTFGRGIWETQTVDRPQSAPYEGREERGQVHVESNRGEGSIALILDLWRQSDDVAVSVVDITGRTLLAERLPVSEGFARKEYRLDLPYGVYFVVAEDGIERRAIRLVVEK